MTGSSARAVRRARSGKLASAALDVTCHTAANSNESYIDCQTHAAREVARVLIGQPPPTHVKDPWLLAEAQDEGFGGV